MQDELYAQYTRYPRDLHCKAVPIAEPAPTIASSVMMAGIVSGPQIQETALVAGQVSLK